MKMTLTKQILMNINLDNEHSKLHIHKNKFTHSVPSFSHSDISIINSIIIVQNPFLSNSNNHYTKSYLRFHPAIIPITDNLLVIFLYPQSYTEPLAQIELWIACS